MSNAYLYNAPSGVEGDITRTDESNVEPAMLVSPFAQKFGIPVKYATGGIVPFAGGEVAADFAGVLTRAAPGISNTVLSGFDDNVPNPETPQNLMVRGYASVKCTIGTPVRGGVVYVRIVAASGKAIGDFEATADGSNNIALTAAQAEWASDGKDDSNNSEIRVAR